MTKDDTRQVEEDFDVEKARQEDSAGVQDYMDEEELIEDLGEPAEEDNADQAIIEAELEDYDAEEEEEPPHVLAAKSLSWESQNLRVDDADEEEDAEKEKSSPSPSPSPYNADEEEDADEDFSYTHQTHTTKTEV